MTTKGKPTSKMSYFRSFNFFRAFFAFAIVYGHTLIMIPCMQTFDLAEKDPRYMEMLTIAPYKAFVQLAACGVDIFFIISSFLTVTQTQYIVTRKENSWMTYVKLIVKRYLRLWTFSFWCILWMGPAPPAWSRNDGSSVTNQWLNFFFMGKWTQDETFVPAWSLVVDFYSSATLITICYFVTKPKNITRVMTAGFLVSVAYRAALVTGALDECCKQMASVYYVNKNHMIYYKNLPLRHDFSAEQFTTVMVPEWNDELFNRYVTEEEIPGCSHKLMKDCTSDWFEYAYFPTPTRISTFFLGGMMAGNFMDRQASPHRTYGRTEYWCWRIPFLVVLVVFTYYGGLNWNIWRWFYGWPGRTEYGSLGHIGDAFFPTIAAIPVSLWMHGCIVPADHPFHLATFKALAEIPGWFIFAERGSWMYMVHTLVILALTKPLKFLTNWDNVPLWAFQHAFITWLISAVLSEIFLRTIERPMNHYIRASIPWAKTKPLEKTKKTA